VPELDNLWYMVFGESSNHSLQSNNARGKSPKLPLPKWCYATFDSVLRAKYRVAVETRVPTMAGLNAGCRRFIAAPANVHIEQ